jgi:hypothetical protein
VRSPLGWWPDDWGHHEGPQRLRESLGAVRVCHERARGPLIAEQESYVFGFSYAECRATAILLNDLSFTHTSVS